ncbi:MAG: hypothetical protein AABY64_03845 [Bdellovibrionota bacterium]|mgnify:CR=1 FL=1
MSNLRSPSVKLLEKSPEVKSYIYQQILEFEPFVTADTVIAVIARDPKKLMLQLESEGKTELIEKLPKMYRIAIILKEGDTKIQDEGLADDIFEAIKIAKEKLLVRLQAIHDSVISKSERLQQIQNALQNPQVH